MNKNIKEMEMLSNELMKSIKFYYEENNIEYEELF